MASRQIAIDEQQYEAVKQRARSLGISEEEVLRRAIDAVLAEPMVEAVGDPTRALAEFFETTRVVREGGAAAAPYRCRRDALYKERERRWKREG